MYKDILFSVLLTVKDIRILSQFKQLNKKTKSIIESKWFGKCWSTKWKHNHLTILLELLPNKPWNYYYLSSNPNITWEIVSANSDKPWNYSELSSNPNITWDIVNANPDKPWNYYGLSRNPNITWEIIYANKDKPWDYSYLSENKNITWDLVNANPDKKWDYSRLSYNPNITWDIVSANPDKKWDYSKLGTNPNITWEHIYMHPDKNWNFEYLLINPNITYDIVNSSKVTYYKYSKYMSEKLFYSYLQDNHKKMINIVYDKNNIYNYDELSSNLNITWAHVSAHPDKPWNYFQLCMNKFSGKKEFNF